MKFYRSQLSQLLSAIKIKNVRSLLLYGPNKGLASKIASEIANHLKISIVRYSYSDFIDSNPSLLCNNLNFLNQQELVKISEVPSIINDNIKRLTNQNNYHFPLFISDELTSNSSLRKYFEGSSSLAIMACYNEDEKSITRIVQQLAAEHSKSFTNDAVKHLKYSLQGDYGNAVGELSKLISYVNQREQISLEDVKKVIVANSSIINIDLMCIHFANNHVSKFVGELVKLQEQNVNEVLIIRALIRFFTNLYIVLSLLKEGMNVDLAIKSLTPPIYYLYVEDFKKLLQQISLQQVVVALSDFHKAELDYKSATQSFNLLQYIGKAM